MTVLPPSGRSRRLALAPLAAGGGAGGYAAPGIELASFIEPLLSCSWRLGAEGPAAWDCWSLFRHVQGALFGREVPRVVLPTDTPIAQCSALLASHPGRSLWRAVATPVHGGAVEMSSARTPLHVGLWLAVDGGVVLHCAEPAGVQVNSLLELRASGWRVLRFYDFVDVLPRSARSLPPRAASPLAAGAHAGTPPRERDA